MVTTMMEPNQADPDPIPESSWSGSTVAGAAGLGDGALDPEAIARSVRSLAQGAWRLMARTDEVTETELRPVRTDSVVLVRQLARLRSTQGPSWTELERWAVSLANQIESIETKL